MVIVNELLKVSLLSFEECLCLCYAMIVYECDLINVDIDCLIIFMIEFYFEDFIFAAVVILFA